jgi:hypothetical protein
MNAGTLLLVARDLVSLLVAARLLNADGTFDHARLASIPEDLILVRQIEGVLKDHGLDVPQKVDQIIGLLPLLAAFVAH